MITLITGTPGAGKTAWTVQEITRLPTQRKLFVHGIPKLKVSHEVIYCRSPLCDLCQSVEDTNKFYYLEDWPEWATQGSLIIADEVQRIWSTTNSASLKTDDISRLQTHRHKGLDFWLISQSPKLLHTGVRTLVGRHIHLVSKWSGRSEYEYPECRDDTSSRGDAVARPYKLPKKVFGLYQSSSHHTKLVHRKPLSFYLFVFVILLIGFFGYRVYSRLNAHAVQPSSEPIPQSKDIGETSHAIVSNKPSYVYPDFKATLPGVPASAPAYAALIKVTQVPHIIGCVRTPDWCKCYSRQGVPIDSTISFCESYIAGNYFNPYRDNPGEVVADAGTAAAATEYGTQDQAKINH